MLVVRGMARALLSADATRFGAEFYHVAENGLVRARTAGGKCRRRSADVGAIEVEPDTLRELPNPFFTEACIGTD
jgi:hypothetical protein